MFLTSMKSQDPTLKLRKNPRVNWSATQQLFFDGCAAHILFLIDCCYAGASTQRSPSQSLVEAIVATGFDRMTPLRDQLSFTTNLAAELRQCRKGDLPIDVNSFARLLQTSMKNRKGKVTPFPIRFHLRPTECIYFQLMDNKPVVAVESSAAPIQPKASPPTPALPKTPAPEVSSESTPSNEKTAPTTQVTAALPSQSINVTPDFIPRTVETFDSDKKKPTEDKPLSTIGTNNTLTHGTTASHYTTYLKPTYLGAPVESTSINRSKQYEERVRERQRGSPRSTSPVPSTGSASARGYRSRRSYSDRGRRLYQFQEIMANEVRILTIYSAPSEDAPVMGEFSVQKYMDKDESDPGLPFAALSCAWTRSEDLQDITIVEFGETSVIKVMPSVLNALRSLRQAESEVHVFLDSVCIDQGNAVEKSALLANLHLIFQDSDHVYAWLGDSDENMEIVADFCQSLGVSEADNLVKDGSLEKKWQALATVLRNPYFSRRWILQELIFAKEITLLCGQYRIPWFEFCETVFIAVSAFEKSQYEARASFPNSFHANQCTVSTQS